MEMKKRDLMIVVAHFLLASFLALIALVLPTVIKSGLAGPASFLDKCQLLVDLFGISVVLLIISAWLVVRGSRRSKNKETTTPNKSLERDE